MAALQADHGIYETFVPVVLGDGASRQWRIRAWEDQDRRRYLYLTAHTGQVWSSEASNLYLALQRLRQELDADKTLLCCNGARLDAQPPLRGADTGAWKVFLARLDRPVISWPLVDIFGPAPASTIATVVEQEGRRQQLAQRNLRRVIASLLNPMWWYSWVQSRIVLAVPRLRAARFRRWANRSTEL